MFIVVFIYGHSYVEQSCQRVFLLVASCQCHQQQWFDSWSILATAFLRYGNFDPFTEEWVIWVLLYLKRSNLKFSPKGNMPNWLKVFKLQSLFFNGTNLLCCSDLWSNLPDPLILPHVVFLSVLLLYCYSLRIFSLFFLYSGGEVFGWEK